MSPRRMLMLLAAATGTALSAQPAAAYPEKAIEYVIPFSPGGESDITARLQRDYFKQKFGHDLIITYKPGRGGADGWAALNTLKADGYTMMGVNMPHIVLQPEQDKAAGYQTADLDIVYWFQYTPDAIMVKADSPLKTLDDMIALARKHPGVLTFSGSGSGTANQLAQVRFDKMAGISTKYVPFKGSGASMTALLGAQVDGSWAYTSSAGSAVERVRLLAIAAEERHPNFPDTPTFKELGYDLVSGAYRGVAVPKNTPQRVKARLSQMMGDINGDREFQKRMLAEGFVMVNVPLDMAAAFLNAKSREYLDAAKVSGFLDLGQP
jgi:tripartite-type tricarboxylate transporter receptor subunit TctC